MANWSRTKRKILIGSPSGLNVAKHVVSKIDHPVSQIAFPKHCTNETVFSKVKIYFA